MAVIYYENDADLSLLDGKTVGVIGYGSQGHAHALSLKDSGVNVIIGLYKGSKSAKVAKAKGFKVYSNAEAVKRADVIFVAVPDTRQAEVYKDDIKPNLAKGKTLFVDVKPDHNLLLSARNLERVRVVAAGRLTARDVIDAGRLIATRAAVERLQEVLEP